MPTRNKSVKTPAPPTTFNQTELAITQERTDLQYAALPFRVESGNLLLLLISSRETRRWVIPKGWPIRVLRPREVAAREALEEAGVVGTIVGKHSIGSYYYGKRLPNNREVLSCVKVYLLSVDRQLDDWLEKEQRECRWMTPQQAARIVQEGGLAELILAAFPAVRFGIPEASKQRRLPR